MSTYLGSMPEANYLVSEVPQYRIIMRHFYLQHRLHAHYVRSDDCLKAVQPLYPNYDELTCGRHLAQLADWGLIRVIPAQSKPANLLELRQRPRIYQAERTAIRLEQLRADLQEESEHAAAMHPTTLEQLVQQLAELVKWTATRVGHGYRGDYDETFQKWHALRKSFTEFARSVENYLADLPRHRPKESLDYSGFRTYVDAIARYLSEYVDRLYRRREYIYYLLGTLRPYQRAIAEEVSIVAADQVLADGSALEIAAERRRCLDDLAGLDTYFAESGDVSVVLQRAEEWIEEITNHARRLSEQHMGTSTVREQTLLDLANRFAAMTDPQDAFRLSQVAFGAVAPLHWRGEAFPPAALPTWEEPPTSIHLHVIRRGGRQRFRPDLTEDRTLQQLNRMQEESAAREQAARELAAMFGPDGKVALNDLRVAAPERRQRLLQLVYRALAHNGRASVGYRDWHVALELHQDSPLGGMRAPDGKLYLPALTMQLHRRR